ncbi:3-dehydroquinate synthase [Candidatus Parcubacteria bacterium]|nr:3-dehydroquinate synthase [Candidatus Parcubacteria bacterium]
MEIRSHRGSYVVHFESDRAATLARLQSRHTQSGRVHWVVDSRVAELHGEALAPALSGGSVLRITASEESKDLRRIPDFIGALVERGIRRDDRIVAIGGGIIQDIACFISSCLFRGVEWAYMPTTLLAQADSCIGSKSSINCGGVKNLVGTFTPPSRIAICPEFLTTLDESDVRSGIGEMLKVHAIAGPAEFAAISKELGHLAPGNPRLAHFIRRSLEIKKTFAESDEFDRGIRNLLNYGHSFGHAIEAATDFAVPHGIAVTMGMDLANWTAMRLGRIQEAEYARMREPLFRNSGPQLSARVPFDRFLDALSKDKKNTATQLALILPSTGMKIEKVLTTNDEAFREICRTWFDEARRAPL